MEEKNEKKVDTNVNVTPKQKPRKIGRMTFGIVMICFGISILVQMFVKVDIFRYVLILWPFVFIAFGLETLVFSNRKNIETKFDVGAIILTIFLLFFGTMFGIVNLGLNKVLYDNDFKQSIIESNLNISNVYTINNDAIKVINLADRSVTLKVVEFGDDEYQRVKVNIQYNKEKANQNVLLALKNSSRMYEFISRSGDTMTITDYPDYLDEIEIIVFTTNKDNVKTQGDFKIE